MKELKFEDVLNEQLKDKEFKKEWDDSQQEYSIIKALISPISARSKEDPIIRRYRY